MATLRQQQIEIAANHFLDLYSDEIKANEKITGSMIHEWWGMTVDQYSELEDDDLELIEDKINDNLQSFNNQDLSKMSIQNVKQIIHALARQNYRLYSDGFSYRPEGGKLTEEEKNISRQVADRFWIDREECEIERDEKLKITIDDYRRWVLEAVEEAAKEKAEN